MMSRSDFALRDSTHHIYGCWRAVTVRRDRSSVEITITTHAAPVTVSIEAEMALEIAAGLERSETREFFIGHQRSISVQWYPGVYPAQTCGLDHDHTWIRVRSYGASEAGCQLPTSAVKQFVAALREVAS